MIEKIVAINFALSILAQAWLVRLLTGSWMTPACIYGLFWFAYTAVPLFAAPHAYINPMAVGYILLTCILFSASAFTFDWKAAQSINLMHAIKSDYQSKFLKIIFLLIAISANMATIINWGLQGTSYYDIVFNLLKTSGEYMGKRYGGELQSNIAAQASIVLTYSAAIIGGILYGARRMNESGIYIIVMSLASSVLIMLVEAAKGTLFLVLVFFWGGIMLSKINKGQLVPILEPRFIERVVIWMPLLLFFIIISFIARGIETELGFFYLLDKLHYYFLSYSSGHLYAFGDWFTSVTTGEATISYTSITDSNGFYTFMSFFNFIGTSKTAPPGVYDDYYILDGLLQTNIYTHYRGLILDFGFIGSMLVMTCAGLIAHLMYFLLLTNRWPWLSASFYVHLIGYIYTSFIISLLIWNSIFASFLISAIILYTNNKLWTSHSKTEHTI